MAGGLRADGAGRGTVEMFRKMAAGDIKACWIICTNPVASVANRKTVIAGLEAAELVVTQDAFAETETNAYADVVLPGALWAEAEGVLVNSERTLTLAQPAADPPGEAMADWQIIAAGPARWATRRASPTTAPRRSSRRSSGPGTRRPARTCAARATSGCAPRRAMAVPPGREPDRNPVSVPRCRRLAVFPTKTAGRSFTPARTSRRRRCPTTTTRTCSTPAGSSTSGTR